MHRFALCGAVALATILGSVPFAHSAIISGDIIRLGNSPGGPGGLLDVSKSGDPTVLFQTFCSHVYEDLDFNTDYLAIISDVTDPDSRPVGPLAAWLYTQFLRQSVDQLPGFDFNLITPASNANATANKQARALQLGVWLGMGFTEQEIKFNAGWSTSFVEDLMTSYLQSWLANFALSGWEESNYIGRIRILNLYGRDQFGNFTVNIQDQLIEIPEPGSAILFGIVATCALFTRVGNPRKGRRS